jgi:hypothetical protein
MARDGAQLLLADLNGDGAKTLADETKLNAVTARNVDIEALARKLGVIKEWEEVR